MRPVVRFAYVTGWRISSEVLSLERRQIKTGDVVAVPDHEPSLRHGYVVNPAPRRIEEFAPIIAGSFADGATFMQALLVARFAPQGSAMLRNLTLTTVQGGDCHVAVLARSELPETIEREFGTPREIVHQALDGIALNREP